jgi:2-desacetyl-2-hydroxyethyl bacteriochlorophyllide A dehydrogenase
MKAAQYMGLKSFQIIDGTSQKPSADEVRLDVGFCGICGTDMHIFHGVMDARVAPPQTIGHEMSGTVMECGENVTNVIPGDRVVVRPLGPCHDCPACDAGHSHICHSLKFLGIDTPGAFQSSWTVKSETLHKLPTDVSLKQGAMIEPHAVACHDVSRARVAAGEKVLIIGGGPIGQLIGLVAKAKGAEVMISEVNESRIAFTKANGLLSVNPIEEDLTKRVDSWTETKGADVVFEVSGTKAGVAAMTEVAAVRGRICMVAIHSDKPPVDLFKFFWRELELLGARVYEATDFEAAIELVAQNKIQLEPFISSVTPLEQINDAFQNMDGNPEGMKALISCSILEEVSV